MFSASVVHEKLSKGSKTRLETTREKSKAGMDRTHLVHALHGYTVIKFCFSHLPLVVGENSWTVEMGQQLLDAGYYYKFGWCTRQFVSIYMPWLSALLRKIYVKFQWTTCSLHHTILVQLRKFTVRHGSCTIWRARLSNRDQKIHFLRARPPNSLGNDLNSKLSVI